MYSPAWLAQEATLRKMVGVMGPGASATEDQCKLAHQIGKAVAESGLVLLSGGMKGTMAEACRGAQEAGGLVVGICPTDNAQDMCPHIDIPIVTAMRGGRNFISILSSNLVIAIGAASAGTLSEIAFAIQQKRSLLIVRGTLEMQTHLSCMEGDGVNILFTNGMGGVRDFLKTFG